MTPVDGSDDGLAAAIIASLPGIFYCFDGDGRFQRWNANLERVSGYDAGEIARMHPLDFFTSSDREIVRTRIAKAFAEGSADVEAHLVAKDRTRIPFYFTGVRVLLEGRAHLVGTGMDLTARVGADAGTRLLSTALDAAADAVMVTDREGEILWVNPAFTRLTGYELADTKGCTPRILRSGVQDAAFYESFWQKALAGEPVQGELVNRRKDGTLYDEHESITPVRDESGRVTHFIAIKQDITERRKAEAARLAAERRFRALFDHAPIGVVVLDRASTRVVEANEAAARQLGYTLDEFLQLRIGDFEAAETPEQTRLHIADLERTGGAEFETRHRTRQGEIRDVLVSTRLIGFEGRPQFLSIFQDITERRRAEAEAVRSLALLQAAFAASPAGILVAEAPDATITLANEAALGIRGGHRTDLTGIVYDLHSQAWQVLHADGTPFESADLPLSRAVLRGEVTRDEEAIIRHIDGSERHVLASAAPVRDADGKVVAGVVVFPDITERRLAEAARRASEAQYRQLFESSRDAILILAPPEWRPRAANPAALAMFRAGDESALQGAAPWDLSPDRQPEGANSEAAFRQQLEAPARPFPWRFRRLDGEEFPASVLLARFELEGLAQLQCTIRDVTAEVALEAQLRQSQKMEAIGQLAGGVAHDFNNILAVVLMQVDLIDQVEALPEAARAGLKEVQAAAERAAALTRQLLLFGRRQTLEPRELELNDRVADLARMLRRIIGEDIRLQLDLDTAPLRTKVDPGMLDQALLNLAVNGRDAMPQGGRLRIETGALRVDAANLHRHPEASPGPYVWLRVSDTGSGIPLEVMPHIFEPFFTTKEPGKGTGLGLATVFGIVKQHGGWIQAESRPGHGARFQIFLPALETAANAVPAEATPPPPRGGSETILLAEDDPAVRDATRSVLERRGYQVLAAAHGGEAVQLWNQHGERIALLLTDLVMPHGLDGVALARRLREQRPGLKVLFTSGYRRDPDGVAPELDEPGRLLPKPCSPADLLEAVRRCLDA